MFSVYIISNSARNALTVECTDDIEMALAGRDEQLSLGFEDDRAHAKCVWLEFHVSEGAALSRLRKIKHWSRAAKINMVNAVNPNWVDVHDRLIERSRRPSFVSGLKRAA